MKNTQTFYERFKYPILFAAILTGSAVSAASFNAFLIPNHLLSGGVSGVALILNYLLNISPGLVIAVLNIPIFALGYRYVDKEFMVLSLVGTMAFSFFIEIFSFLRDMVLVDDIMLACIFGGLLNGLGLGMVFRNRASMGGVDILAVIVKKYWSMNIGTTSMVINFIIVAIASFYYGLKPAMFTLIAMYISSVVIDKVQQGFNTGKSVMIITDKEQEVAAAILKKLDRGVTYLEGEGAYTGVRKKVVYCIVTLNQLAKLKQIVSEIDKGAFVTVNDTAEVLGRGFANRGI